MVIAPPRGGSSYLRCRVAYGEPIFGELLIRNPSDECATLLQSRLIGSEEFWPVLEDLAREWRPSVKPGAASRRHEGREEAKTVHGVVGLNLIAPQLLRWCYLIPQLVAG